MQVCGDELRAFGRGMDAVVLNGAGNGVDVRDRAWEERDVVFRRDARDRSR